MKVLRMAHTIVLMLMLCVATGMSQDDVSRVLGARKTSGSIPVGFGATFIDGEVFYLINITPEVAFGQLGVGLDLNLRFNTKGRLRVGD